MRKANVFVTRPIPEKGLALLQAACDVTLWEDELPPPYTVLRENVREAEGILCLLSDQMDADLMQDAPHLKVISQMAVGYDNIDIKAATAARLPVGHTPGVLTDTTADFAFSLLLAAARRISEGERFVRAGKWRTWGPTLLMGQDIYGATLGIIGLGRIGLAVAQRARGFNMRVIYHDMQDVAAAAEIGAERRPLEALLTESDFVSLHTPLLPETHHLMNDHAFQLMKPTAILVNTSRGPVVDANALHTALTTGAIAYAALDVTDPEPISPDDPLLKLDNCLIVPHIASSSVATRNRMAVMAAENLLAGLQGERLPNCVNPQIYDSQTE